MAYFGSLGDIDVGAIDATKAVTAVDVFVYDTRKDSDGGAWRTGALVKASSWYNETLNTATRGARREFPAVAVIVAEAAKITIYDGDEPDLPMWMMFSNTSWANGIPASLAGANVNSIIGLNGKLVFASSNPSGQDGGIVIVSFISDDANIETGPGWNYTIPIRANILQRNAIATNSATAGGGRLVDANVNDIAMTVLPGAPIDSATGLPVPTIAVATAGGVSVIKDDGTVVDIVNYTQAPTKIRFISISGIQRLITQSRFSSWSVILNIPTSDITLTAGAYFNRDVSTDPLSGTATDYASTDEDIVIGKSVGLLRVLSEPGIVGNDATLPDLRCDTKSTYTTGWMPGDIKGAFLADKLTTSLVSVELVTNGTFSTNDLTGWTNQSVGTGSVTASTGVAVITGDGTNYGKISQTISGLVVGQSYVISFNITAGNQLYYSGSFIEQTNYNPNTTHTRTFVASSTTGTIGFQVAGNLGTGGFDNISIRLADADRSVNNKGLVVNGTVTRSVVATGAELVGYSGFSTTNYLEQPYNSGLDFGTGDFCVMGWGKRSLTGSGCILISKSPPGGAFGSPYFELQPNGSYITWVGNTASTKLTSVSIFSTNWMHIAFVRISGVGYLYIDGKVEASSVNTESYNHSNNDTLRFGTRQDGYIGVANQSMALWRISATAPTADQIAKIYNDEKVLFQENAKATLFGTSDAVTALAHDSDTGLLHVGTSAGRSMFSGLRRVDNTTDAVGTAISASNGLVVEE